MALFEPFVAGKLRLKNRTMRSPTWEGLATPAGQMTEQLYREMDRLAAGGVGLVCFSHSYVQVSGRV